VAQLQQIAELTGLSTVTGRLRKLSASVCTNSFALVPDRADPLAGWQLCPRFARCRRVDSSFWQMALVRSSAPGLRPKADRRSAHFYTLVSLRTCEENSLAIVFLAEQGYSYQKFFVVVILCCKLPGINYIHGEEKIPGHLTI